MYSFNVNVGFKKTQATPLFINQLSTVEKLIISKNNCQAASNAGLGLAFINIISINKQQNNKIIPQNKILGSWHYLPCDNIIIANGNYVDNNQNKMNNSNYVILNNEQIITLQNNSKPEVTAFTVLVTQTQFRNSKLASFD